MPNVTRLTALGFTLALACAIFGCGGKGTGELGGSVTYKSKPLVHGTVTVFDSEGRPHQSSIDQGKYRVTSLAEGAAKIIVVSDNPSVTPRAAKAVDPRAGKPKNVEGEEAPPPLPGWFAIPTRYATTDKSPLKLDIKVGKNDYDISLVD